MSSNSSFHYPPELFNLLVETIPLLNRSKKEVFIFFQGAGVPSKLWAEPHAKWKAAPESVNKYDITRHVLVGINSAGDTFLGERREVLKRVSEFESFDACWPKDVLKAKGCVAEVRKLTELKDSVTKLIKEQEQQRQARMQQSEADAKVKADKLAEIERIKNALFALFAQTNPHIRGKALEGILNDLFKVYGVSVREAFTLVGVDEEGVIEQIDGVIGFEGHLYLVEMKWWKDPVGVGEIAQPLIKLFERADARGIIISASNFTEPAISQCRGFLDKKVIILSSLEEIVRLLNEGRDLKDFLSQKIHAATLDMNPWFRI